MMRHSYSPFLIVALLCFLLTAACSGDTANNTSPARNAPEYNRSSNSGDDKFNANFSNLSAGNASNSFNSGETQNMNDNRNLTEPQPPPEINYANLALALKTQLQRSDGENQTKALTEEEWKTEQWKKMPIGSFYKNVDKLVGNRVCDVTNDFLKPHNQQLSPVAEKKLRTKVNAKTICDDAVGAMRDAVRTRVFIKSIG